MKPTRDMVRRRMANTGETEEEAIKAVAALLVPKDGPSLLFWLSFVDPARPEGRRFVGACLVEARDFLEAGRIAHAAGCNPGGEMKGHSIRKEIAARVGAAWKNRLLTREECDRFRAKFAPN
jgi:hypothetical protein